MLNVSPLIDLIFKNHCTLKIRSFVKAPSYVSKGKDIEKFSSVNITIQSPGDSLIAVCVFYLFI